MKTVFKFIFSVSYIILYILIFISANDLSEKMAKTKTEIKLPENKNIKPATSAKVLKLFPDIKI
jgi:hypothetical protein